MHNNNRFNHVRFNGGGNVPAPGALGHHNGHNHNRNHKPWITSPAVGPGPDLQFNYQQRNPNPNPAFPNHNFGQVRMHNNNRFNHTRFNGNGNVPPGVSGNRHHKPWITPPGPEFNYQQQRNPNPNPTFPNNNFGHVRMQNNNRFNHIRFNGNGHVPGVLGDHHKPWITPELQEMIRQRNVLQKRVNLLRIPAEFAEFKTLRNKVTTLLNAAKFDYEIKLAEEPKSKRIFYCDTCDKSCFNQRAYDSHVAEHIVCKLDDCTFTAHPKVVLKHIQMQHSTNLYHRIKGYKTEEEIKKWVDDRKKNFPTEVNLVRKKAEKSERRGRGERIPKTPKFKYLINQSKRIENKYNNNNRRRGGQGQSQRGFGQVNNSFLRNNSLVNCCSNDGQDYIHSKNQSEMVTLENFYYSVKIDNKRNLVGKKLTLWSSTVDKHVEKVPKNVNSSDEEEVNIKTETIISITDDEDDDLKIHLSNALSKKNGISLCSNPPTLKRLQSTRPQNGNKPGPESTKSCTVKHSSRSAATIIPKVVVQTKTNALAGLGVYGSDSEGEIKDSDDEPPEELKIQYKSCIQEPQTSKSSTGQDPETVSKSSVRYDLKPASLNVQSNSKSSFANAKRKKLKEKLKKLNTDVSSTQPKAMVGKQKQRIVQKLKRMAIQNKSKEPTVEDDGKRSDSDHKLRNSKKLRKKSELNERRKGSWTGNKAQKPHVKVRPRWRPPTLLERLLNEDIEREGNYLLQACRFIIENNFFEETDDKATKSIEAKIAETNDTNESNDQMDVDNTNIIQQEQPNSV